MARIVDSPSTGVPYFDLSRQLESIRGEIRAALDEVLDDGMYTNGPAVETFEERFAAFCNVPHCVAVSTGTSALHLALACLDVGPGDEVITVPMSFMATAWPILYAGATPVFVDVDPNRMTMDPEQLERAITPKTKAIIVVHLYGQMADMTRVLAIAESRGVPVIEDCAQSHGAQHRGRTAGSMGLIGCFSFYPSKNLGGYGEAGAITTHDPELAERCRRLRSHAQTEKYVHSEIGYNYRLSSFQAAVLSVKLGHLEAWTERRIELAAEYDRLLADSPVRTPAPCPDGRHVYHLYVVRHDRRDELRAALERERIFTAVHYPLPIHLQPVLADRGFRPGDFPVTESIANTCISLPLYPEMPAHHPSVVADAIRRLG